MSPLQAAIVLLAIFPVRSFGACSSPAGDPGQLEYRSGDYYWCNGTSWFKAKGSTGSSCSAVDQGVMKPVSSVLSYCNGTNWIEMEDSNAAVDCSPYGSTSAFFYQSATNTYYICSAGVPKTMASVLPATCGGASVGGYCWYIGSFGASCTSVCSSHGGTTTGAKNYAGSSGSNSNCQSVLTALGFSGSVVADSSIAIAAGCTYTDSGFRYRLTQNATTDAASDASLRRACSCAN